MKALILTGLVFFVMAAGADCTLGHVYPAKSSLSNPVRVVTDVFQQNGQSFLRARFTVQTPSIYATRQLAPGQYPYMFDVVEMFVADSAAAVPYSEFELSPYGQTFQVRILDLHKPFIDNANLGEVGSAQIVTGGWTGEIVVPLASGADPTRVVGNIYGVFGRARRARIGVPSKWRRPIRTEVCPNQTFISRGISINLPSVAEANHETA